MEDAMTTKDKALEMAIEEIEGWFEDRYVTTYMDRCKENPAWLACKEALEQPAQEPYIKAEPVDDYDGLKKQFYALRNLANSLDEQLEFYRAQDYSLSKERLQVLEESLASEKAMNSTLTQELEHPAQEPLNLNCKSVQKRLATQWGYVEQPAQEPDFWMKDMVLYYYKPDDTFRYTPLYTHPAPSWQRLSDDEIIEKCAPIWGAIINTRDREETVDFARSIEQASRNKNGF